MVKYPPLPYSIKDRKIGRWYLKNGDIRGWDGKRLLCLHERRLSECTICCVGDAVCKHKRVKWQCKDCGGSQICEHGRSKGVCKECGGNSICKHNRVKYNCRDCGGSRFCKHNIDKYHCKECDGRVYCEHNRQRQRCKDCGGGNVCEHRKIKANCKVCEPHLYLRKKIGVRINAALTKNRKSSTTLDLLGCSVATLSNHLEIQFTEGMVWDNHGEWHIDHIRPCASFDLSDPEQQRMCFHYTNLQPLWKFDNLSKNDSFDAESFDRVWNGERWVTKY